MQSAIYVSLSSQLALQNRLTTIADNVANAGTAGFRATEIRFDQLISRTPSTDVSYVSSGEDYLSTDNGGLKKTGNDLDFAVKGDSWFAINTPAGQTLTRDGRFTMTPNGDLVSVKGYPVLDAGGAPIQLDPTAGSPSVAQDGTIHQNGKLLGAIGLYGADMTQGYTRVGNSGVIPTKPAQPVVDRTDAGVMQGYVEDSNVNPISEMTKLIMVQRAFDDVSAANKQASSSLDDTVKVLGGTT